MIAEMTAEQIEQVLGSEFVGLLGCHAGGETYVVPITYAYREGSVYGHSAEGRKVRMMRENAEVCFEVDHLDNLSTWQSVIGWGTYEELHGEDRRRKPCISCWNGSLPTRRAPPVVPRTRTLAQWDTAAVTQPWSTGSACARRPDVTRGLTRPRRPLGGRGCDAYTDVRGCGPRLNVLGSGQGVGFPPGPELPHRELVDRWIGH